jgi:hypothetical protein
MVISTALATLASAVIVLTGVIALARQIFRISLVLRDNIKATESLGKKTDELGTKMENLSIVVDDRISTLESKVAEMQGVLNVLHASSGGQS